MNPQRSLFDPSVENGTAAAYRRGSDTSRAAAERVNRDLSERQRRVLAFVTEFGTATCREVAKAWGVGLNVVSGRLSELQKLGKIEPTGARRDGCTVYRRKHGGARAVDMVNPPTSVQ